MTFISQFDVLCGKDKTYESHSGNRLYRDMIVAVAPQYAATTAKQDKMKITSEIVSTLISHHGGRFLKLSLVHGEWEEINVAAARDKTSHALRFCAAQMTTTTSSLLSSSMKRKSKSKARKGNASQKVIRKGKGHRRKVSYDGRKTKCVSPDITPKSLIVLPVQLQQLVSHQPISFDYHDMNGSLSTWCVPDMSQQPSIHDLSSNDDYYFQHHHHQQQQTIIPFTSSSNPDIDTLWSYQLQEDDEFPLVFT